MYENNIIIDCFAGGGGASVGIEMALGRSVDIAINHSEIAIRMHRTNHPKTLHLTEDIFKVDLQKYVGSRHVALMWASPDCTQFSKAKGGKPRLSGIRMLPWAVYKHAKAIIPDVIIMENVEEIQQWGPLDDEGHPIKERMGETYDQFIAAMKGLGYEFDSRELVAADYGAPTTRKRWYAVFRRDGKQIVWPRQTHSKGGLVPGTKPWEPVWKCLDLMDIGKSIFGRKKPLAEKTLRRTAAGLRKFVFENPEPFIVTVNHGGKGFRGQSIHEPLSTITAKHGYGIVTPQLGKMKKEKKEENGAVFAPFLIQYHSETSKDPRGQAVTEPVRTIDTSNRYGLVISFIEKFYKTGTGQEIMKTPLHTVTTSPGHFGKISVLAVNWEQLKTAGIDEDTAQKCTWVSQYLIEYYGCSIGQSLNDPMHTIVTKDRFALITVLGSEYVLLDIFLRMLSPRELARAQGFPDDYILDRDYAWRAYPKSQQAARIGNSVVPIMAEKLVSANCGYLKVGKRAPAPIVYMERQGQLAFA